ncbi:AmmeMemoRadiSam system protein A [bacterium]|nr:AmmeMemoRadiSam system protein A [bacterium]MBU1957687.1 AmmeMemoRadiSam system protein A [bacterium]
MKKELLLSIASEAIQSRFDNTVIDIAALIQAHPELKKLGAVFVTLKQDGNLRGCIGSLVAHRSLLDDVIQNAKAAAFGDPRFPPLLEEEFEHTDIEISLLSTPQELHYTDREDLKRKIRPQIDGVVLKLGFNQATFLPQVWEDLPDFDLFFAHLCQKAGLRASGCLESHPSISTYQVERIE